MSDATPVYLIVMLDITDMEAFRTRYVGSLQAVNERHGAEPVLAAPEPRVLEGTYDKTLTVILRFPSAQAQEAWYADPDYQPLLQIRHELTDTATSVVLVAPAA